MYIMPFMHEKGKEMIIRSNEEHNGVRVYASTDYAKTVEWMIEHRNIHPVMDVELIHGQKVYIVFADKQPEEIREIIAGRFAEGERVTVNIDGNEVTRVVKYSGIAEDLYVTFKNAKYFACEFERN